MTYVLSDIHGDKRRLDCILEQIALRPDDRLYVLGDAIDRKPDGADVLDLLLGMKNVTMLLGNHELMMIEALSGADLSGPFPRFADRAAWDLWEYNGGLATLRGLMKRPPAGIDGLLRKLDGLPLTAEVTVNGRAFLLVHGAPPAAVRAGGDPAEDERSAIVWGRVTPEQELYDDRTVVFGHTPTVYYQDDRLLSIWYGKNRIGIDCGCAFDRIDLGDRCCFGRLGCLRLDDMREFYAD